MERIYKLNFMLKTINILGLSLVFVGSLIMYCNSPLNFSAIDGGSATTDYEKIRIKTTNRNKKMKIGLYLIDFGTILQIISNFFNED